MGRKIVLLGMLLVAAAPSMAAGGSVITGSLQVSQTAFLASLLPRFHHGNESKPIHPAGGPCVCGYQPNNHCVNGKVYQFSYCRDADGQSCGTADVDTGNTC